MAFYILIKSCPHTISLTQCLKDYPGSFDLVFVNLAAKVKPFFEYSDRPTEFVV